MSAKEIKHYHCRWNVKNREGIILIYFSDNKRDHLTLKFRDAEEFHVTMSILSSSFQSYLTSSGEITSGWEPIDG